jgi:hypothetical protein
MPIKNSDFLLNFMMFALAPPSVAELATLIYTAKNNSDAILIKLEELAASEFIKEAYGILRI